MSSFKDKNRKPQISKTTYGQSLMGGDCDQYPTFSFRHLTTHSDYNLNYYSSNQVREMQTAKQNLYDRMEELCKNNWLYWMTLGKQRGLETLEYSRLKFGPHELELLKDEKVFIFRFKAQNDDARIIGYRKGKCPILHVIGYDFNFSAYDHGR